MYIHEILKRQSSDPSFNQQTDTSSSVPTYVWIVVVILVSLALTCGICARRNYRRQHLYRGRTNSILPPSILPWSRPFPGPGGSAADLQPPPRARRGPSQSSVTSLPVYMERPGEREVVLLQRTGPKEEEGPTSPPPPPVSPDISRNTHEGPTDTSEPVAATVNSEGTQPVSTVPPDLTRSATASAPPTANPEEASAAPPAPPTANPGEASAAQAPRPSSPPPPFSSTNPFNTRSQEP